MVSQSDERTAGSTPSGRVLGETTAPQEVNLDSKDARAIPEYVSTGFITRRCGVSNTTVLRWIADGKLPAFRLPSGHYRVGRDEFNCRHIIIYNQYFSWQAIFSLLPLTSFLNININ